MRSIANASSAGGARQPRAPVRPWRRTACNAGGRQRMASTYLDRGSPPHITTLGLATAAGSLTMTVLLPSLPGMARFFQTDYAYVQLAVSLYLGATAVLQLFIGPASDRFG